MAIYFYISHIFWSFLLSHYIMFIFDPLCIKEVSRGVGGLRNFTTVFFLFLWIISLLLHYVFTKIASVQTNWGGHPNYSICSNNRVESSFSVCSKKHSKCVCFWIETRSIILLYTFAEISHQNFSWEKCRQAQWPRCLSRFRARISEMLIKRRNPTPCACCSCRILDRMSGLRLDWLIDKWIT